jgi:hypothetical protein
MGNASGPPEKERPGVALASHPGRGVVAVDAQSDNADPPLFIGSHPFTFMRRSAILE